MGAVVLHQALEKYAGGEGIRKPGAENGGGEIAVREADVVIVQGEFRTELVAKAQVHGDGIGVSFSSEEPAENMAGAEGHHLALVGHQYELGFPVAVGSLRYRDAFRDLERSGDPFGGEIDSGMDFEAALPLPVVVDMQEASLLEPVKVPVPAIRHMGP